MNELDFRSLLREEHETRQRRNPGYSARAMARDLELSPAFYSQIMSGARALSLDRAIRLTERLAWPTRKRSLFVKLVQLQGVSDERLRGEVLLEIGRLTRGKAERAIIRQARNLDLDCFRAIADWHHFAIVELTALPGFVPEPAYLAGRLGISPEEARIAWERILRIGLVEDRGQGFRKGALPYRMRAVPSPSIRAFHKQHLAKAAEAIETQPPAERDFSGTTMAIDPRKLPRAKAMIRKFHRELEEFLEGGGTEAVYHLAVQFYRLDRSTEGFHS